jgi:hypothetical protein
VLSVPAGVARRPRPRRRDACARWPRSRPSELLFLSERSGSSLLTNLFTPPEGALLDPELRLWPPSRHVPGRGGSDARATRGYRCPARSPRGRRRRGARRGRPGAAGDRRAGPSRAVRPYRRAAPPRRGARGQRAAGRDRLGRPRRRARGVDGTARHRDRSRPVAADQGLTARDHRGDAQRRGRGLGDHRPGRARRGAPQL